MAIRLAGLVLALVAVVPADARHVNKMDAPVATPSEPHRHHLPSKFMAGRPIVPLYNSPPPEKVKAPFTRGIADFLATAPLPLLAFRALATKLHLFPELVALVLDMLRKPEPEVVQEEEVETISHFHRFLLALAVGVGPIVLFVFGRTVEETHHITMPLVKLVPCSYYEEDLACTYQEWLREESTDTEAAELNLPATTEFYRLNSPMTEYEEDHLEMEQDLVDMDEISVSKEADLLPGFGQKEALELLSGQGAGKKDEADVMTGVCRKLEAELLTGAGKEEEETGLPWLSISRPPPFDSGVCRKLGESLLEGTDENSEVDLLKGAGANADTSLLTGAGTKEADLLPSVGEKVDVSLPGWLIEKDDRELPTIHESSAEKPEEERDWLAYEETSEDISGPLSIGDAEEAEEEKAEDEEDTESSGSEQTSLQGSVPEKEEKNLLTGREAREENSSLLSLEEEAEEAEAEEEEAEGQGDSEAEDSESSRSAATKEGRDMSTSPESCRVDAAMEEREWPTDGLTPGRGFADAHSPAGSAGACSPSRLTPPSRIRRCFSPICEEGK